eukprot:scaffold1227_cov93-Skeletonema_dohrnii-CCMP3373.AAC.1
MLELNISIYMCVLYFRNENHIQEAPLFSNDDYFLLPHTCSSPQTNILCIARHNSSCAYMVDDNTEVSPPFFHQNRFTSVTSSRRTSSLVVHNTSFGSDVYLTLLINMFEFSDSSSIGTGTPPTSTSNHHSSSDESEDESVSMGSSGSSWAPPPEAMLDDQDSITEGFASDEEQNAMEDASVTFPVIPGTAYYGDGQSDHDKIPDPDIDMIYARGTPDMLLIPLQAGFIDFGGHVERRSDMQGKVRVGNGMVQ